MPNTISASALRDRLLSRVKEPPARADWVRVLGVPGHCELLGLIARHNPTSIGALAEIAGRAQSNVSRSLTALVKAGLIEVVSDGRRSLPRLTEMGAAKAREFGLHEAVEDVAASDPSAADQFSLEIAAGSEEPPVGDSIKGQLTNWLWLTSTRERVPARTTGDLDALGRRLLENWWRVLYRRDAPFRLWGFTVEDLSNASYSLVGTVVGTRMILQARPADGPTLSLEQASRAVAVSDFERHLLAELLRPLAAHHWLRGRSARPLHALLQRVEESRDEPNERAFCRTAGSLGLAPYDLSDERAKQIRDLIDLIPDEDARLDFGSAILGDALVGGQHWARQQLEQFRKRNSLLALDGLRQACKSDHSATVRPYRHGYALARNARVHLNLTEDEPVGGIEGLSKMLGAIDCIELSPEAPGMLRAFQSFDGSAPTFIVENEGARSSAFTLARSVGDYIAFGSQASCVADLYTDRQAVGRAFAAEFMAPRGAVVRMIEEEDLPISKVADHFGVTNPVVERQYQNAAN